MAKRFRLPFKIVRTRPAESGQRRSGSRSLRLSTAGRDERQPLRTQINPIRVALAICTIAAITALLTLHLVPDQVSLRAGDRAPDDIRAERTVSYTDVDATQALREAAASRVDPIYSPIRYVAPEALEVVDEACNDLDRARVDGSTDAADVAGEFRQNLGIEITPPNVLTPILNDHSSYHLADLRRTLETTVQDVMERDIRGDHPDDLATARAAVTDQIDSSNLPRSYLPGAIAIARAVIRPNSVYDEARTQSARDAERRLVAPEKATIFTGDLVVARGDVVTPEMIDKLRALGLQNPRVDPVMVLCTAVLVALMVGIVQVFLSRYHKTVYASTKILTLLSLLALLGILGLKLGDDLLGPRLSGWQFGYIGMICVAAAGMLVSALVNPRIALLMTALMAAGSGVMMGSDLRFPLMTLLSTLVAVYAVSDIRERNDLVRAAVLVSLFNVALSVVVGRLEGDSDADLRQSLIWAAGSGMVAVAIFSLGAALFERPFGVTTHLGLLELSDPNRPLLRRFCELAPGTYTHSIQVANLAVAAAEAIGADALLCRVGAYYHDLGKMKRAEFFVENQRGSNAHERLTPSLSALVVTAHVKDGLEIADEEKLPPVIKAFITEHHGTSLVRYFYSQHTGADDPVEPGLEQHFRYGGPKPQSRETAILMLADSVEAASRTLDKPTVGRIEDLVDKIIAIPLIDGQLDECDITLKDLRGIRNAFVRLLAGMLHSRIEYPDSVKQAALSVDQNGYKTEKNGTSDQADVPSAPGAEAETPANAGDQDPLAA
jgi:putative nucleotidyltransferase with HDIG domain